MSAVDWFVGFLLIMWVLGYGIGSVFVFLRKFIDKVK